VLLLLPLRSAPLRCRSTVRACAPPPDLPLDAIVLSEEDKEVWLEEQLEYSGLRADPRTPRPLQAHIASFHLPNGRYGHAFEGGGVPLSAHNWEETKKSDGQPGSDGESARLALALDLLDSVNFLHSRGSAHLALDSDVVRVMPAGRGASGLVRLRTRLSLVGLGAAVRLQSRVGRMAFQLPDNVAFHAPELLDGFVIESNLRALFAADSWSVGCLLAMILGGWAASPFEASADWAKGTFSAEAAVQRRIGEVQGGLGPFLWRLNADSGGLLFRNGWLCQLLIGLLMPAAAERLTVHEAWKIARQVRPAGPSPPTYPGPDPDSEPQP
jgi:serine/threonine protein kinase